MPLLPAPNHVKVADPKLVGILNVTPDSFSDAGEALGVRPAMEKARRLCREGADWIDIGGESTRPGALAVSPREELQRTIPVVAALKEAIGIPLSIDTTKAVVARTALEAGASMVNDISALRADPQMPGVVAESGCLVCLMHMQGEPATMQQAPHYSHVVDEIKSFLLERAAAAVAAGIDPARILLDPGIGFGKTLEHNLAILQRLAEFTALGFPLMLGASRKSFLGKLLGREDPGERVGGSLATTAHGFVRGVTYFRVHDVAAHYDLLTVLRRLV